MKTVLFFNGAIDYSISSLLLVKIQTDLETIDLLLSNELREKKFITKKQNNDI